jgi:ABC-2 type transport system permease protein
VFAGSIRIFLFTIIPAAFVSAVPATLVDDFDVVRAIELGLVAAGFAFAAGAVFTAGLRRYTSGSIWTRA